MRVRKAMLAGSWYPGTAEECKREIDGFIKEGKTKPDTTRNFVGGIVPHAGWYFSGSIACNVIGALSNQKTPDVIAIFGMHLHSGSPCYIMNQGAWNTPLGDIEIETNIAGALTERFDFQIETTDDFIQDNTIEVQLPFIKHFFKDVKIVPIGVPPIISSFEIGKAVVDLTEQAGLNLKVIGSTDLTHYGSNYGFIPEGKGPVAVDWVRDENDRRVVDAMLSMDSEKIIMEADANNNACCAGAAATAIVAGKCLGSKGAEKLAYATSYDKSPGDSFVGYAGILF
jgi:AmmeMemoRadiSam system protein B